VTAEGKRLLERITGVKPAVEAEAFAEPESDAVRVQLRYQGKLQLGTVMPHQRMPWAKENFPVPVRLDNSGVWTHELPSDLTVIDGSDPDWALPHKGQSPGI
jgi:hypothetical protein